MALSPLALAVLWVQIWAAVMVDLYHHGMGQKHFQTPFLVVCFALAHAIREGLFAKAGFSAVAPLLERESKALPLIFCGAQIETNEELTAQRRAIAWVMRWQTQLVIRVGAIAMSALLIYAAVQRWVALDIPTGLLLASASLLLPAATLNHLLLPAGLTALSVLSVLIGATQHATDGGVGAASLAHAALPVLSLVQVAGLFMVYGVFADREAEASLAQSATSPKENPPELDILLRAARRSLPTTAVFGAICWLAAFVIPEYRQKPPTLAQAPAQSSSVSERLNQKLGEVLGKQSAQLANQYPTLKNALESFDPGQQAPAGKSGAPASLPAPVAGRQSGNSELDLSKGIPKELPTGLPSGWPTELPSGLSTHAPMALASGAPSEGTTAALRGAGGGLPGAATAKGGGSQPTAQPASGGTQTLGAPTPPRPEPPRPLFSPETLAKILFFLRFAAAVGCTFAIVRLLLQALGAKKDPTLDPRVRAKLPKRVRSRLVHELAILPRGSKGLSPGEVRKKLTELYRIFCEAFGTVGVPRADHEPPDDYARDLEQKFPPLRDPVHFVTDAFSDAFYGEAAVAPERLDRAHEAVHQILHTL